MTSTPPPSPIAEWRVPVTPDETLTLQARAGEVITVVGSNGAGKSALVTWMAGRVPPQKLRRLLAHRKIWFQHAGPSITPADRETYASSIDSWDRQGESRFLDHADSQRTSIALFDLLGALNDENRRGMELLDRGFNREEVAAELGLRLLPALNATLKSCGLHIEIGVTAQQTFEVRHTDLGVSYPIYRMSDGEKSALLLAADVLTADANSIIMIDEPERHLHRAISAELVEAIVATRSDCAFVVLTHDVDLASRLSKRPGDTLSITGVVWSSNEPSHWQLHEVEPDGSLPEEARRAILGGRQDVLFIEGKGDSLDLELYRLLFPNWQLLPVGGCDLVIRSVTGLRESQAHHWINPIGIVDRDGRSEEERASLSSRSIHALPVSEIENLYLDPQLLEAVAQKQSTTIGIPAEQMIESANRSILSELRTAGTLPRIAKKLAKDEVARKLVAQMPSEVSDDDIEISFPSPYPRALAELQNMLEAEDVQGLMRAIPIRNTGVRAKVAAALRFTSVQDYQQAARVCVSEDQQLAESLREAVVPKSELAA